MIKQGRVNPSEPFKNCEELLKCQNLCTKNCTKNRLDFGQEESWLHFSIEKIPKVLIISS
jgi:hypothetical protein